MDNRIICWRDTYLIGDPVIDTQHKMLISMIEQIDELSNDPTDQFLQQVFDYALYHFKTEEDLMRKAGYPDFARHTKLHHKLVDILNGYRKDYEEKRISLFAFKNFLFIWVKDHILDEDMKISEYFKKNCA